MQQIRARARQEQFAPSLTTPPSPLPPRVLSIRPHPEFISHGFYNDVALLKLDRPVDFTEYILPVCLPSTDMARQPLDHMVGQTPSVIGWGSTAYGAWSLRVHAVREVWEEHRSLLVGFLLKIECVSE